MWLKGCLPFVAVAALAFAGTLVEGTTQATTTTTVNPDTEVFTVINMKVLYNIIQDTTYQPIGPGTKCTGTGAVACVGGSSCVGLSSCSYCICDPFTYGIRRSLLNTYEAEAAANRWVHRGYYSSTLAKCLKPMKIGESCEENDQCPHQGGTPSNTRNCDATTETCKCKDMYHASADGLSCVQSGYNQKCSINTDCSSPDFKCEGSLCKCDNTKHWYEKGGTTGAAVSAACRRGYWDEPCVNSADCDASTGTHDANSYLTCDTATSKCKCNPNYYQTKGTTTPNTAGAQNCEKILVGAQNCAVSSTARNGICYDGHSNSHTRTTECDTDRCKCKTDYPMFSSDNMFCSKIPYQKPGCKVSTALEGYVANKVMAYSTASDSRCESSQNLACADDVDKCLCDDLKPKRDSNTCRKLNVLETGCSTRVDTMSDVYTTGNDNTRCVSNAVCDSNTCRCPETHPIWDATAMTCSKVKVGSQGCSTRPSDSSSMAYASGTTADNTARCYDGTTSTVCTSNTCECIGTKPSPATNKMSCMLSGYGQTCDALADCSDSSGSPSTKYPILKCSSTTGTGTCICNADNKWSTDGSPSTGAGGNTACKRIDLDATSCRDDADCETNDPHSGIVGSATCDGTNTCKCASGSKRYYGTNECTVEFQYDAPCETAASNQITCHANMTCTSNKCACTTSAYPSNVWNAAKGKCLHSSASYTVANGATCTNGANAIEPFFIMDPAEASFTSYSYVTWRKATSNTRIYNGNANSAVQRCADTSAICMACDLRSTSTEDKTCQTYTTFHPPSGDGARPAIALLTLASMVVLALKLA